MPEPTAKSFALTDWAGRLVPNKTASLPELQASWFAALSEEFNPSGLAQTLLVREVARRGAQLVRDEQSLDALRDQAGALVARLLRSAKNINRSLQAELLVHERLEVLARRTQRNSDSLLRGLRELDEIVRNRAQAGVKPNRPDPRFLTEAQCVTHLVRRFRSGRQACRDCAQAGHGCWIANRRCWECQNCHTQTCVRYGTVFARSHVPLVPWFHAVAIVLYYPRVSPRELAMAIGVRRVPTVRTMLNKIQAALLTDDASQRLAGLDHVYLPA
jgi:hypothetical protein